MASSRTHNLGIHACMQTMDICSYKFEHMQYIKRQKTQRRAR